MLLEKYSASRYEIKSANVNLIRKTVDHEKQIKYEFFYIKINLKNYIK